MTSIVTFYSFFPMPWLCLSQSFKCLKNHKAKYLVQVSTAIWTCCHCWVWKRERSLSNTRKESFSDSETERTSDRGGHSAGGELSIARQEDRSSLCTLLCLFDWLPTPHWPRRTWSLRTSELFWVLNIGGGHVWVEKCREWAWKTNGGYPAWCQNKLLYMSLWLFH